MNFSNIKTLVVMQLKDKLDLSFVRNKRSLTIKSVLAVVKPAAVTAVFFLLFMVAVRFSVFSFSQVLPDTVVNVLFTTMQLMAIFSCSVGLSQALFASADNKVLLTLPVSSTEIFLSKLILFYLFELRRNVTFSLPVFLAYGLINNAVWYYYPWMLLCFAVISLLPVAIGAVLSIPTMYVVNFVRRHKVLQLALMTAVAGVAVWVVVALINLIPENINLLGQWGTISTRIQGFLNNFARVLAPFYWLCLMTIGGTLRISAGLFGVDTLAYFGGAVGVTAIFGLLAFLLARPLFFKMASKLFEYEKMVVPPKKNKVHSQKTSPYFESWRMEVRSSRRIALIFAELALPAVVILFLNRLYAAMNTSFAGQKLTQMFNIVVMLVTVLSFNTVYASVYSREASARNLLKTRPTSPLRLLFARISSRMATAILSCVAMVVTYAVVSKESPLNMVWLLVAMAATAAAHLLWCAETDVMNSQADQFQTVGADYNNPNERNATFFGILLAAVFAAAFYLFTDTGVTTAFAKIALLGLALLGFRILLYVKRVNLYFAEN